MVKNPCGDIKKTRKSIGMNQTEFWERLGLKQSTGSRLEREQREISQPIKMLIEIAYGTKGEHVIARLRGES